jgi:hypothetical protein
MEARAKFFRDSSSLLCSGIIPTRERRVETGMNSLTRELRQLRETDPELGEVLGVYDEIDKVYRDALQAMGMTNRKGTAGVRSSAEVTLSFQPPFSTADEQER